MLCNGKYYIGCNPNLQVQVRKEEHERIRTLRNEPLVEVTPGDEIWLQWTWIQDANCDEPCQSCGGSGEAETELYEGIVNCPVCHPES